MIRKIIFSFLVLIMSAPLYAQQTKEEIQKKQQDLQREIEDLNRSLQETKNNKKQSLSQYTLLQRKIRVREDLVNNLNKEMHRIDDEIYAANLDIYRYKRELDTLKENYSKSLVFAYKNRSNYDYLNFLFSATSFNDAIKRIAYLKSYRQYRETQVSNILKTQQVLQQKTVQLASSKTDKNRNIGEQNKQLKVLQDDKTEVNDVLSKLKSDEKNIASQIKDRERTRSKLQLALRTIINKEIAEAKKREQERLERERIARQDAERKRKLLEQQQLAAKQKQAADAAATAKANNDTKQPPAETKDNAPSQQPVAKNEKPVTTAEVASNVTAPARPDRTYSPLESTTEGLTQSLNFENNRGRLPWPADAGFVAVHFGVYQIPGTTLRGNSDGIDISMNVGASIKAVADGEVSTIVDLDNQTVVVRHGKYFTTYSNLSSVNLTKGQHVKAGTVIGRVAAGSDGEGLLTFMITNDKGSNLNPEQWLRRK